MRNIYTKYEWYNYLGQRDHYLSQRQCRVQPHSRADSKWRPWHCLRISQTCNTHPGSEVAKRVHEDAYALIFGLNTLAGLVVQTLLTLAVAGDGGLALSIQTQYVVYVGYFLTVGAALLAATAAAAARRRCCGCSAPYATTT